MGKVDPRADPVSQPPDAREDFSVDRVVVPKPTKGVDAPVLANNASELAAAAGPQSSVVEVDPSARKVTSRDPRFEPIEKLLDGNDWRAVASTLGPIAELGALPPNLAIVGALAHHESTPGSEGEAAAIAIRCVASLLGLPSDSPIARVLARRMLRKNPVKLRERQAPPAKTSLLIVVLTLAVGSFVGWLASIGSWRGIAHALHLL